MRYRFCLKEKGYPVDVSMRRESLEFDMKKFFEVSGKYFQVADDWGKYKEYAKSKV